MSIVNDIIINARRVSIATINEAIRRFEYMNDFTFPTIYSTIRRRLLKTTGRKVNYKLDRNIGTTLFYRPIEFAPNNSTQTILALNVANIHNIINPILRDNPEYSVVITRYGVVIEEVEQPEEEEEEEEEEDEEEEEQDQNPYYDMEEQEEGEEDEEEGSDTFSIAAFTDVENYRTREEEGDYDPNTENASIERLYPSPFASIPSLYDQRAYYSIILTSRVSPFIAGQRIKKRQRYKYGYHVIVSSDGNFENNQTTFACENYFLEPDARIRDINEMTANYTLYDIGPSYSVPKLYLFYKLIKEGIDQTRILSRFYSGRDTYKSLYDVVIRFIHPLTLEDVHRTISVPQIYDRYDDFYKIIVDYLTESDVSGVVNEREKREIRGMHLDTSVFWVNYSMYAFKEPVEDTTNSKYMIYQTVAHPEEKNDTKCIYLSLLDCGYDVYEAKRYNTIEELVRFIREKGLPISVIFNIPEIDYENNPHRVGRPIGVKLKKYKNKKAFHILKDEHVKNNYYYEYEGETKYYICYDAQRGHVEKVIGKPKLIPDMIYMADYEIIKFLEEPFPRPQEKEREKELLIIRNYVRLNKQLGDERIGDKGVIFIFFDIEAVTDYEDDNFSAAYSISYMISDIVKLNMLEILENDKIRSEEEMNNLIKQFIQTNVEHINGFNCIEEFINEILNMSYKKEYDNFIFKLVGFNNSSYDNFILLNSLNRRHNQYEDRPIVEFVEYHGNNRIGDILFADRFSTFDLRRHLTVGSLNTLCKDFGIKRFAKKGELISHRQIQKLYNDNGVSGFLDSLFEEVGEDKLIDYNNYDVLSLALLFYKYNKFIKVFTCIQNAEHLDKKLKPVYDHVSLPSYLYTVSQIFAKSSKINFPSLSYSQYEFIRSGSIAGRIDTFGKNQSCYEEELMSLDCTSMYPYTMFVMPVYFPCGHVIDKEMDAMDSAKFTEQFQDNDPDILLGYYTVNIMQANLILNNLPLIICKKTNSGNNYNFDQDTMLQKNVILSSVDIQQLFKYRCPVEFVIGGRVVLFTGKVKNYDLFGWLKEFMTEKNRQDEIANQHGKDSELYSSSIRNLCKLLLNILSGKYMQKVYETVNVVVNKKNFFSDLTTTKDAIPNSHSILGEFGRKSVIISYKKQKDKITNIKPIFVGSYIYAYSRQYMYNNIMAKLGYENCLYHDTDSVKFRRKDFEIYLKEYLENTNIPHNFELELIDQRFKTQPLYSTTTKLFGGFENEFVDGNEITYINTKKEYASFKFTGEKPWFKFSMKGVQARSVVLFKEDEELYSHFIYNNRILSQNDALDYDIDYHQDKSFEKIENLFKVFYTLFNNQPVNIMNTQFIRDIRTTNIKVNYIVKTIYPGNYPVELKIKK